MGQINQVQKRIFPGMEPTFQQHYSQMIDAVNSLAGYNGVIQVKNHLDLGGNRVMNVASPQSGSDVVTQTNAQSNYSASALRPQLEANGASPLQTSRHLNDQVQREQYSSFLNDTFSAPPSANNTTVLFSGSGGSTTITIPAGKFTYADGTTMAFGSRTDTVTNPTSRTISSISATGGVVTVVMSGTLTVGPYVGQLVGISGVTPSTFDGSYIIATVISTTSFTYLLDVPDGTGTGGNVTSVGVYYYYLERGDHSLRVLDQVVTTDTPFTRLPTSTDGRQLIAIALVNSGGGVTASSAGGGTPQSQTNAGSFF